MKIKEYIAEKIIKFVLGESRSLAELKYRIEDLENMVDKARDNLMDVEQRIADLSDDDNPIAAIAELRNAYQILENKIGQKHNAVMREVNKLKPQVISDIPVTEEVVRSKDFRMQQRKGRRR